MQVEIAWEPIYSVIGRTKVQICICHRDFPALAPGGTHPLSALATSIVVDSCQHRVVGSGYQESSPAIGALLPWIPSSIYEDCASLPFARRHPKYSYSKSSSLLFSPFSTSAYLHLPTHPARATGVCVCLLNVQL